MLGDSARTNFPSSFAIAASRVRNHFKSGNIGVESFIAVLC
jgi:hypothetical protein